MSSNNKKPVLITGASRGIGAAIAEAFAKEGYPLYLCCKNSFDKLEALSTELSNKYSISCTAFSCDVGNEKDVIEIFDKMKCSHIGVPTIIINNAGVAHYGLITDMTSEEWRSLMSVNLDSLFYVCKNAVPFMLQNGGGRILNISSVWGNVGASCEVAYSASKGGVNSFTKALAKELAPSHIPVNAIACGMVNTEMNSSHLSEDEINEIAADIPADRICEPWEVAALALKLIDAPDYLTGQIITMDGGWI
ncbi:MAG: SDR family oxidoreductase [Butyrivibrio sp.]|nr:SDR family oxidoreductase [Butyrivibrio sp.]